MSSRASVGRDSVSCLGSWQAGSAAPSGRQDPARGQSSQPGQAGSQPRPLPTPACATCRPRDPVLIPVPAGPCDLQDICLTSLSFSWCGCKQHTFPAPLLTWLKMVDKEGLAGANRWHHCDCQCYYSIKHMFYINFTHVKYIYYM